MAVKSTFRSSNPSESFRSTTFQFSLEKVCWALRKFHKAQTTNTPPTHRRRISYVIKLNSGQCVDWRVDRRVGQRVGGIGFLTFTVKLLSSETFLYCLQIDNLLSDEGSSCTFKSLKLGALSGRETLCSVATFLINVTVRFKTPCSNTFLGSRDVLAHLPGRELGAQLQSS